LEEVCVGPEANIKWVLHRQSLTCHRDVVFSVEAYGDDAGARLLAAGAATSSQRDIAMKLALPVLLAALIGSPAHAQTTQDNRRDVVLWYEAFDQKNPALLDHILAPEWVDIPSLPGVPPGPAGAKRTLAMLTTTFPDLRIVVEDIIQDGDKVVVRSTISGTQRAEFVGIRAQGRRLNIQAVDIHEFKDGKILRTWHTEDWMTGLNQLGAFER
jgi:steroid delta-isomerase-like uncharacterized protein